MSADHPNGPARIASREEWLAARIALLDGHEGRAGGRAPRARVRFGS